jgi:hypothetical protein
MSADNVVILPVMTRLDCPPERILDAAKEAGLTEATVVGYDADGNFYFASSKASGAEVLWTLEIAKRELLNYEVHE